MSSKKCIFSPRRSSARGPTLNQFFNIGKTFPWKFCMMSWVFFSMRIIHNNSTLNFFCIPKFLWKCYPIEHLDILKGYFWKYVSEVLKEFKKYFRYL